MTETMKADGITWQVVDSHTGCVVGTYRTSRAATSRADKLSLDYGSYRYNARMVFPVSATF